MRQIKGIYAPLTTPFSVDGKHIDIKGLEMNMKYYANSELNGFLVLGSNGENKNLTEFEKREVMRVVISSKSPGQKVMVGCIYESTYETIEKAKVFEKMGADYIALMSPSYFAKQMTDDVLFSYFTDVANSVSVPCLIYNAPQFCGGVSISAGLIKKLSGHKNFIGVKDSSIGNIGKYLLAIGNDFNVLAGSAHFFLDSMLTGASGGVLSLANILPAVIVKLYKHIEKNEYDEAIKLNKEVIYLNSVISGSGGVAAVKKAMDLVGLTGGNPRLPLKPLTIEAAKYLEDNLMKLIVIDQ